MSSTREHKAAGTIHNDWAFEWTLAPHSRGLIWSNLEQSWSYYPAVEIVKSSSTEAVILGIDCTLIDFCIPHKTGSNNGPPFCSYNFNEFTKKMGLKHVRVTPYADEESPENSHRWKSGLENSTERVYKILLRHSTQYYWTATSISAFQWKTVPHQTTAWWAPGTTCQRKGTLKHR